MKSDLTGTMTDSSASNYMRRALEEANKSAARGDLGVGAVVVLEGKVVAGGGNEAASTQNPFAHAEIQALTDFLQQKPQHLLKEATLYTTFEPCPMCLGACLVVGLGTIVVGGTRAVEDQQWGGYQPNAFAELVGLSGPRIRMWEGPYREECVLVRTESLERTRKNDDEHDSQ